MNSLSFEHLKAVEDLIARYRSITVEDVEDVRDTLMFGITHCARNLTGFGSFDSCTLCRSAGSFLGGYPACTVCIHGAWTEDINCPCRYGDSKPTYDKIDNAKSPAELVVAFRERADYLETRLKMYR